MNMKIDLFKLNNLAEKREIPFIDKGKFKTNDFVKYLEKNKVKTESKLKSTALDEGEKDEKIKNNEELLENVIPYYLNLTSANDISKFCIELEEALKLLGITEDNNFDELSEILYFIESNISLIDELDFIEKDDFIEKLTSTLLKVKNIMKETKNNNDLIFTTNSNEELIEEGIELIIEKLENYIAKESKISNREEILFNGLDVNNKEEFVPEVFLLDENDKDNILVKEKSEGSIYYNLDEIVEKSNSAEDIMNNEYNLEEIEELDTEEIIDENPIVDGNRKILFENRAELGPRVNTRIINNEFIDKEDIVNQIVDKTKLIIDENKPEIQVKLKPEVLGELILEVEVKEGLVLAKALVESYRTKELIETNIVELKEGLEEQGLEIKTFEVSVGSDRDFEQQEREGFTNNHKPKLNKVILKDEDVEKASIFYKDNISHEKVLNFGDNTIDLMA